MATINGDDGDNNLVGTSDDDIIAGGRGNDTIDGGDGDDTIDGGRGSDTIVGSSGRDTITGGIGADIFTYGINGYAGVFSDTITDLATEDRIIIRNSDSEGLTVDAVNEFTGTAGEYTFSAGGGQTFISIDIDGDGAADETLTISNGEFNLIGVGFLLGPNGVVGYIYRIRPETVGTEGNDILYGGPNGERIDGFGGDDIISDGLGNDIVDAGAGNDTITLQAGDDTYFGQAGDDTFIFTDDMGTSNLVVGGLGIDTIDMRNITGEFDWDFTPINVERFIGGDSDERVELSATEGADTIFDMGGGNDYVVGGLGNDTISGGRQNDTLIGGFGNDILLGELGADILYGGLGNDLILGGNRDDQLFGEDGDDRTFGGNGNDVIDGGAGVDILRGGSQDDRLNGGADNDVAFGGTGRDDIAGGDGNDLLFGRGGFDTLNGGAGNDILEGGLQADQFIFEGAFGNDTITDFAATNNAERINLSAVNAISDFQDLIDNHMNQVGNDVLIDDLSGNTITLSGVILADLDAADFVF